MQMRSVGVSCRQGVFDIVMRFSEGIGHREEKGKLGMVQEGLKRLLSLFNPWRSKMLRFCGRKVISLSQNSIFSHKARSFELDP